MALSNTAMVDAVSAITAKYVYAQLHSASAGANGTSNAVADVSRVAFEWTTPTGDGDTGLDEPIDFTGGDPGSDVYSVTIWSASTGGTFGGEFTLSGDQAFNAEGEYTVKELSLDGSAS